ncbi:hypothetical protein FA592_10885 [Sulfurospirillum diekertiae]|uniref:Uncharacterized protein n=1 Tax=Sulfurospirillum diekertiae TaxID=1854492 RepID=A0A1Y0HIK7_9BACT|nr:hypothetical protein [Sulfurospirillum diekertiae]ARU47937.1 hypothetical protein Sdiek1_0769 [Sulfurospirillum diekertiae]ASC92783.1 hypothetical protein Sdiek2_0760 [Sulfurospirillum diekertiae]QIR76701.1 hypothetical protein FA584_11040 [Sulfurospirillum diekertiae]QIR79332.1 hypothetical protein FA592_10885 [Sulfurospirillum diekertiae]
MKKALLFLAIASHISLFAGFLDDLIGKDKTFLEANGFKCTEFSCVTKDQNYFNVKLLDNAIEYVEVYSTDKDEVYRVALYLYQNDKLKNKELDEAFFKALTKLNDKSKLTYDLSKVSDKFGNEALITITDAKRATAYTNTLRDTFFESMKQYSETGSRK